jgi:hypothetical protein
MKFYFTCFLLRVLRYYYYYYYYYYISWVFSYTNKKQNVVDSGILWKLQVALDQEKSAQAWPKVT